MSCHIDGTWGYGSFGGDAMLLRINDETQSNGGWCDYDSSQKRNFIC